MIFDLEKEAKKSTYHAKRGVAYIGGWGSKAKVIASLLHELGHGQKKRQSRNIGERELEADAAARKLLHRSMRNKVSRKTYKKADQILANFEGRV